MQVADKARQVKKIIFIIQLPGPSLSKVFLKPIQHAGKMGLKQQQTATKRVQGRGEKTGRSTQAMKQQHILDGSFAKLCGEADLIPGNIDFKFFFVVVFYFFSPPYVGGRMGL